MKTLLTGRRGAVIFLGVAALLAAVIFVSTTRVGNIPVEARDTALREMGGQLGFFSGAGSVYIDRNTQAAVDETWALDYVEALKNASLTSALAYVMDAGHFNKIVGRQGARWLKKQEEGKTWKDQLTPEFQQKVLRAAVIVEKAEVGYYFIMATGTEDKILVTLFDKEGDKKQFRGFYKDYVPFRSELPAGWYLLFTAPLTPADFEPLKKERQVTLHYAKTGTEQVSVALLQVHQETTLSVADPVVAMIPLREGW